MRLLLLLFAFVSSFNLMAQGITTSTINGRVTDDNGQALIGATIVATHIPSGTLYGTVTNEDGYYRLPGLRVGGPYKITSSYTGYGEVVMDGISLLLGEVHEFNFRLSEAVMELTTVTVVAQAGTVGENAGTRTQISSDEVWNLPTIDRDLDDFLRLTPQSTGYSDGTSFGGVNNRYNAIYIDGAVNNDVFGLASSGTNGGSAGTSPFSMDIIDQIQVALSPYDVSYGGFAGAAVNAVTKSGTNNVEGTAYYFLQNENLVGKTNQAYADLYGTEREKVAEFSNKIYGASLGGPIVKDKLFFFANVELQKEETPILFNFDEYGGTVTTTELDNLRSFLINTYGYDPGSYGSAADELDGLKLFGKLDFNLNENHKLTLRHSYTKGEQFDRNVGSSTTINFSNNGIYFPTTTNSTALELNSRFGYKTSNNLILGLTTVNDDRDPLGSDFPYVIIEDGSRTIRLGSEEFSTGNALEQTILSLTNNFKIYSGAHTFTIGTHNEFYDIYNLFIRQNYGTYRYGSIADFIAGRAAKEYDRTYSLVDDLTGDGSAAAADFNAMQLGFYVQDEWLVNSQFTLTAGLRLDIPLFTDDPVEDTYFNTTALPLMRAQYDIANDIEAGKAPDGQLMLSPRIGFNYDISGNGKNILRGGVGVFTSRIPFVWPGAMYNNNGLTLGGVNETTAGVDSITFIADIQDQYTNPTVTVPSGDINLFTKDFKYPQILRANLGLDTKLPGDISATFEGVYTKTINNVFYTNINNDTDGAVNWTNTPDDRIKFTRSAIDNTYGGVYVGSNTNEGYTYTLTAALSKEFSSGLNAMLSYTYGDAYALSEGTSSQNSSQWRGQVTQADGRNEPVFGRSDFALGHRVLGVLGYTINWTADKNVATTISLVYNGFRGSPYSYVVAGSNGRNLHNESGSTSAWRSLVWVPENEGEINLVDHIVNGNLVISAEDQWNNLNAFIEADPYLSENRGQYAEKNSNWMPFTSYFDLSVRQDFGVMAGGKNHKLQLSWDVFNFANLLNSEWGVRYSVPGDFNNYFLYEFAGYESDDTTPTFKYLGGTTTGKEDFDISNFSSRWQMRLGLRYIFN